MEILKFVAESLIKIIEILISIPAFLFWFFKCSSYGKKLFVVVMRFLKNVKSMDLFGMKATAYDREIPQSKIDSSIDKNADLIKPFTDVGQKEEIADDSVNPVPDKTQGPTENDMLQSIEKTFQESPKESVYREMMSIVANIDDARDVIRDLIDRLDKADRKSGYFEITRLIFPEQKWILSKIRKKPYSITLSEVERCYDAFCKRINSNVVSLEDFYGWLIEQSLMLYDNEQKNFAITVYGKNYVTFLEEIGDFDI